MDLPAPDSPTKATAVPAGILNETFLSDSPLPSSALVSPYENDGGAQENETLSNSISPSHLSSSSASGLSAISTCSLRSLTRLQRQVCSQYKCGDALVRVGEVALHDAVERAELRGQ